MIGDLQHASPAVVGHLACIRQLASPNPAQVADEIADPSQLGLDDLERRPDLGVLDVHEEQLRLGQAGGKRVVDVVARFRHDPQHGPQGEDGLSLFGIPKTPYES